MGNNLTRAVEKKLKPLGYGGFKVNLNGLRSVSLGDIVRYENGAFVRVARVDIPEDKLSVQGGPRSKGRFTFNYENRCKIHGDIQASATVPQGGVAVGGEVNYDFSSERCVVWDLYHAYLAEADNVLDLAAAARQYFEEKIRDNKHSYFVVTSYIVGKDGVLLIRSQKSAAGALKVTAKPIAPAPPVGQAQLSLSVSNDAVVGICVHSDPNTSITPLIRVEPINHLRGAGPDPFETDALEPLDEEVYMAKLKGALVAKPK